MAISNWPDWPRIRKIMRKITCICFGLFLLTRTCWILCRTFKELHFMQGGWWMTFSSAKFMNNGVKSLEIAELSILNGIMMMGWFYYFYRRLRVIKYIVAFLLILLIMVVPCFVIWDFQGGFASATYHADETPDGIVDWMKIDEPYDHFSVTWDSCAPLGNENDPDPNVRMLLCAVSLFRNPRKSEESTPYNTEVSKRKKEEAHLMDDKFEDKGCLMIMLQVEANVYRENGQDDIDMKVIRSISSPPIVARGMDREEISFMTPFPRKIPRRPNPVTALVHVEDKCSKAMGEIGGVIKNLKLEMEWPDKWLNVKLVQAANRINLNDFSLYYDLMNGKIICVRTIEELLEIAKLVDSKRAEEKIKTLYKV